jgi:hypothetical protein
MVASAKRRAKITSRKAPKLLTHEAIDYPGNAKNFVDIGLVELETSDSDHGGIKSRIGSPGRTGKIE